MAVLPFFVSVLGYETTCSCDCLINYVCSNPDYAWEYIQNYDTDKTQMISIDPCCIFHLNWKYDHQIRCSFVNVRIRSVVLKCFQLVAPCFKIAFLVENATQNENLQRFPCVKLHDSSASLRIFEYINKRQSWNPAPIPTLCRTIARTDLPTT